MEVIYPNQEFYDEEIHGISIFKTIKRVIRRSVNEFKEQRDHKAKAEEYDFLITKTLSLIKREFGDDVRVLMYEEHDIVAEIVLHKYGDDKETLSYVDDRIDKIRDGLRKAHAHWMKAHGIRRGCWGCDETSTVPGRKRCAKSTVECGKYVKDDGPFPHVFVTTHYVPWGEAVEYYNDRYKGIC
jgi:hypothetical protein